MLFTAVWEREGKMTKIQNGLHQGDPPEDQQGDLSETGRAYGKYRRSHRTSEKEGH